MAVNAADGWGSATSGRMRDGAAHGRACRHELRSIAAYPGSLPLFVRCRGRAAAR